MISLIKQRVDPVLRWASMAVVKLADDVRLSVSRRRVPDSVGVAGGICVIIMLLCAASSINRTTSEPARVALPRLYTDRARLCSERLASSDGACGVVVHTLGNHELYCIEGPPRTPTLPHVIVNPGDAVLGGEARSVIETDSPCPHVRVGRVRHAEVLVNTDTCAPVLLTGDAAYCFQHMREVAVAGWKKECDPSL